MLLAIAAMCACVSSTPAGVAIAIDADVVKNSKNFILPGVITVLNELVLPQINFSGGYVKDIVFKLDPIDPQTVVTNFDGANNALSMKTEEVGGQFSGKFYYSFLLLWIEGNFDVKIKNGGAHLELDIPLLSQSVGGK
jgi:hypothetical protein